MDEMNTMIASLSAYTKQVLQGQIDRLNAEVKAIDLTDGPEAWAEMSKKSTAIADLEILLNEVPTLEETTNGN